MDRISPKEVLSMMNAVAQVYEQPEAEQLDEIVRNLRPGETIKQYDERKRKEAEAAAQNRDKIVPNRGAYDELTKAQQNSKTQRENEKKLEDLRRQRRRDDEEGLKPTTANLPSDLKDTEQTATAAGQKVAGKVSGSLPADYKETELQAGKDAEKSRTGAGLPQSGGGNQGQGSTSTTKPTTASDPNVTKDGTKFERRMPTSAELRAAQQARRDAPKVLSRDEIENRAVKAGVGVAKGTVKDPKIAADANRKAELERIRQRAASQTRAGVRPTVASTADSKSRTAAGIMSNKSASGSGPGGYQLPAGARPLTSGNAAARSLASRLAAIRAAKSSTTQPSTTKSAPVPSTTGATTTPTVKPVATTPTAQVRGREAMMARQKNPRNRNTQLNQGDPMERMTGKGAASLLETYSKVYEEREPQAIDEGIMGALKKVGKAVLGPADQSPEAEAERMGKRRPQGEIQRKNAVKMQRVLDAEKKEDVDLFDIIKGHFIEEGLTEEEALVKMFELTEDEKCEILNKTTTEENQ